MSRTTSTLPKSALREMISTEGFKTAKDIQSYLKDLFKDAVQEMLEAELEASLGYSKGDRENKFTDNRRNGYSDKTVKSELGEIVIDIPRDRDGDFQPMIVPKNIRDISGIEDKVISLYSRGMSTRDINEQINDIYGFNLSAEKVSQITDTILPKIKEWQNRPLESIYTFVFMDAIHYKVREDGQIKNKAAYVVIGVNIDGFKDILGIWIGQSESSKFWLGVLNDLKNRGVQDVLIFSVDGLTGIKEAITAAYPKAEIQRCIIHQLRNTMRYVSYKHLKEFVRDFKEVYRAPNEDVALEKLEEVKTKWSAHYPNATKSWEVNWDVLSPFFKFSDEIRKIMYTTNVIESLNRQFRKITKTKTMFPTDESLEKMLYLSAQRAMKKWTVRYRNWDMVISQLNIYFGDTLSKYQY